MAWHLFGAKPLPELMMANHTEVHIILEWHNDVVIMTSV